MLRHWVVEVRSGAEGRGGVDGAYLAEEERDGGTEGTGKGLRLRWGSVSAQAKTKTRVMLAVLLLSMLMLMSR